MTYKLFLGDRTYSSWSLRGWLLFENFGIAADSTYLDFSEPGTIAAQIPQHAPARTVPTVITPEGAIVSESLAIAEELATRHPEASIWPSDPLARATARTLAAEMASGFMALRSFCPMHLRIAYRDIDVPEDVQSNLARLELIWSHAREATGSSDSWLCGDYSAADAFYAPVAARIAGYGLSVSDDAQAYVAAHLSDPAFRRWRAMGIAAGDHLERYRRDHKTTDWPGPAAMTAQAVETGTPENERCPYSGKEVTHLAEIEGRIFGFCNAFCRDKTVADAAAFPAFMKVFSG